MDTVTVGCKRWNKYRDDVHRPSNLIHDLDCLRYGFKDRIYLYDRAKDNLSFAQRLKLAVTLNHHEGCVNCISWNDSGSLLLSGSDDLHLVLCDPFTNQVRDKFKSQHKGNIFCAKFLPNTSDTQIISGSAEGRVCHTTLDTSILESRVTNVFKCHKSAVYEILSDPNDSHTFLTCGEDCTVRWVDLRVKSSCNKPDCQEDVMLTCRKPVMSMSVNPVRPYQLALGCGDSRVRIIDRRMLGTRASGNYCSRSIQGTLHEFSASNLTQQTHRVTSVQYSSDGSELLASFSGASIYLFNFNGGVPQATLLNKSPQAKEATVPALDEDNAELMNKVHNVKRLRLRGDWSDTGPNARPESERGASDGTSDGGTDGNRSMMQHLSDLLTRWLEQSNRRHEEHAATTTTTTAATATSAATTAAAMTTVTSATSTTTNAATVTTIATSTTATTASTTSTTSITTAMTTNAITVTTATPVTTIATATTITSASTTTNSSISVTADASTTTAIAIDTAAATPSVPASIPASDPDSLLNFTPATCATCSLLSQQFTSFVPSDNSASLVSIDNNCTAIVNKTNSVDTTVQSQSGSISSSSVQSSEISCNTDGTAHKPSLNELMDSWRGDSANRFIKEDTQLTSNNKGAILGSSNDGTQITSSNKCATLSTVNKDTQVGLNSECSVIQRDTNIGAGIISNNVSTLEGSSIESTVVNSSSDGALVASSIQDANVLSNTDSTSNGNKEGSGNNTSDITQHDNVNSITADNKAQGNTAECDESKPKEKPPFNGWATVYDHWKATYYPDDGAQPIQSPLFPPYNPIMGTFGPVGSGTTGNSNFPLLGNTRDVQTIHGRDNQGQRNVNQGQAGEVRGRSAEGQIQSRQYGLEGQADVGQSDERVQGQIEGEQSQASEGQAAVGQASVDQGQIAADLGEVSRGQGQASAGEVSGGQGQASGGQGQASREQGQASGCQGQAAQGQASEGHGQATLGQASGGQGQTSGGQGQAGGGQGYEGMMFRVGSRSVDEVFSDPQLGGMVHYAISQHVCRVGRESQRNKEREREQMIEEMSDIQGDSEDRETRLELLARLRKEETKREEEYLRRLPRPEVTQTFSGHRNSRTMIKEAVFWGDRFILSGSDCGHIFIWERESGRLVNLLEGDKHVVNCLQPHPTDMVLATCGIDHDVKLWMPLSLESIFDESGANRLIERNRVMLEETEGTITVPATFMLRMLASLSYATRNMDRQQQQQQQQGEQP